MNDQLTQRLVRRFPVLWGPSGTFGGEYATECGTARRAISVLRDTFNENGFVFVLPLHSTSGVGLIDGDFRLVAPGSAGLIQC
jgi:hypothetical protein